MKFSLPRWVSSVGLVCTSALLCLGAQAATPKGVPNAPPKGPAVCSWDSPGQHPFMGDVVAAVDHYTDIPAPVRARLKARMASRDYEDWVTIRRDAIAGRSEYDNDIRSMHFGDNSVCGSVTRGTWTAQMQERGLVYCESGECILVPTVCRNVSRIKRRGPVAAAPGTPVAAGAPPPGELVFEPPGAGMPATGAPVTAGPLSAGAIAAADAAVSGTNSGSSASGNGGPVIPPPYYGGSPGGGGGFIQTPVTPVPEPAAMALMLLGLAALFALHRARPASTVPYVEIVAYPPTVTNRPAHESSPDQPVPRPARRVEEGGWHAP